MARGGRVRTVSVRVTAQISDFEKKIRSVKKQFRDFGNQMEKQGKQMTKMFTVPFVAAVAAIGKLTHSTMQYADEIDKMAVRTGMSVDRLQELKFVSDQLGVSFESLQTTSTALLRSMASAEKGTGETADAFRRLRIDLKDSNGSFRDTADVYEETIKKLGGMKDQTEQGMMALKLFGRQAQEILPLIRAGEGGIDALTKRFRELGLGLDKDTIDKFVRLKDAIAIVRIQFQNVGMTIATAFLPIVEKIAEFVGNRIIPAFQNLSNSLGKIDKNFLVTGGIFAGVLAAIGPLSIGIGMLAKVIAALSVKVLAIPVAIAGVVTAFVVLAKNNEQVTNSLKTAWEGVKTFFVGLVNFIKMIFDRFGGIIEQTMSWVIGKVNTELRVIGNVFAAFGNLLQGNWKGLWQNVLSILEDIGRFLVSTTGSIVKPILKIFEAMATHITDKIFMAIGKKLEEWVNKAIGLANSAVKLLNKTPGINIGTIDGKVNFQPSFMPSDIVKGFSKKVDDMIDKYGMQDKFKLGDMKDVFGFNLKDGKDLFGGLKNLMTDLEETGTTAYKNLTNGAKEYVDALRSQTHAFANFVGIFDKAERTTFSPGRLLSRMRGQVKVLQQWQNNLQTLEQRGVSQQLMNELRGMGAGASGQIQALTKMDSSRLAEFQSLYGQRMGIAGQEAQNLMSGQRMVDTLIESQINITISESNISSEDDVERVAGKIVQRLKLAGIKV